MKKKHRKGQSRHHLKPRSRHGNGSTTNLLTLKIERHELFHKMFGNRSLDEVIALLIRIKRAKENQKGG